MAREIPIVVGSLAANNHTTIGVTDADAAQLQPSDIVYIRGLYIEVSSATQTPVGNVLAPIVPGGTVQYSQNFGQQGNTFFLNYEQVLIVGVANPGSAGPGLTTVTIRRAFQGQGANDFGGQVIAAPVAANVPNMDILPTVPNNRASMCLLVGLPTFPEGSDAPRGYHGNPQLDNNFTQEFKYAVETTKEASIEKTYIGKTQIELHKLITMRRASLQLERTAFFGLKGKSSDSIGRLMYTTGGQIEFIKRDAFHVHTYPFPQINFANLQNFFQVIAEQGGSSDRDLLVGINLYNAIRIGMHQHPGFRFDIEDTKRFDIPIEKLVGPGFEVRVIPLYSLQEMGWGNKGILWDSGYSGSFVPVTHEGWDMRTNKIEGANGAMIDKEQWVGIKGFERRYAQYHHILNFPNVNP
jgi:hypothetical protein